MIKKVEAASIKIGMYLCQMDKPWFETPFLHHKFLIKSKKQIDSIRQYCSYIYIDTDKGEDLKEAVSKENLDRELLKELNQNISTPKIPYREKLQFVPPSSGMDELEIAKKIRFETKRTVANLFENAKLGKNIDSIATKAVVGNLLDSIVREKNAMLCISLLKNKDEYTKIHSMNVSVILLAFGHHIGLPKEDLEHLGLGGLVHDVGRIHMPQKILDKPASLTTEEFEIVKTHVTEGVKLLESTKNISQQAISVAQLHHERQNGSGYPKGLKGDEIPLFGQMSAIVDVYDSITTPRSYSDSIAPHEALKLIYGWSRESGEFNSELVEKFIQCMGVYPIGSLVELNTGDVGIVTSVNRQSPLKPELVLVLKPDLTRYHPLKMIDTAEDKSVYSGKPYEIEKVLKQGDHNISPMKVLQQNGML
ncbi:MAG: HD-GYP domain-containing protein [Nitrospinota bacterium]